VKEPAICAGWYYETRQGDAVSGALAGALAGTLGGAVLGQIWQREVWTALPRTRSVRLHVTPDRGSVGSRERAMAPGVRIALR
jgi:outer membrane lipoprotein SlyB